MSSLFAKFVAIVGGFMIMLRQWGTTQDPPAIGDTPDVPEAKPQGIFTLKMPTAKGWPEGEAPTAAPGLKVNAFARDLKHPRWIHVLPNGDVTVSEALGVPGGRFKTPFEYAAYVTMKRAAAIGDSANRISLLRDADGDGVAEIQHIFKDDLIHPFGMAMLDGTFYVGNTDALMGFSYEEGMTRLEGNGERLAEFKPGGHWTRSILPSPDGRKLYIGVGSESNIGEPGDEAEAGRAAIHEFDRNTGEARIFASGLRNPVGVAWEPSTGELWTVVNERDGLGDEVPPDYLTSVKDGGFYGWPYCYWGQTVDDRVPQKPELVKTAIRPDYALGGHTASLGLCWLPEGTLNGFGEGMVIGQHGSWNRSNLSGYRVVFVPFKNGKPCGEMRDILSGFLSPDEKFSYGRPVGVTLAGDGSLLVADDVGNVVWRVTNA